VTVEAGGATGLTCRELVELVSDYIEEGLSPAERREFERHLVSCGGCRAYLDQMRASIEITACAEESELPATLRERLLETYRDWKRTRE
jgi:hypothetical protein